MTPFLVVLKPPLHKQLTQSLICAEHPILELVPDAISYLSSE